MNPPQFLQRQVLLAAVICIGAWALTYAVGSFVQWIFPALEQVG